MKSTLINKKFQINLKKFFIFKKKIKFLSKFLFLLNNLNRKLIFIHH